MEPSRTQRDETEAVDTTVDPAWGPGGSMLMTPRGAGPMTNLRALSVDDVTCQALHLAMSALQIDLAWHAGAMSAEAAMKDLHHEVGKTVRRCNEAQLEAALPLRVLAKPPAFP